MAAQPAEHAQQDATLRWVALGTLIPNAFSVEAALRRLVRCRYSAIQNNVHLRPPTARSDTVAFILPSIPDLAVDPRPWSTLSARPGNARCGG
jgi:hypothetical protein